MVLLVHSNLHFAIEIGLKYWIFYCTLNPSHGLFLANSIYLNLFYSLHLSFIILSPLEDAWLQRRERSLFHMLSAIISDIRVTNNLPLLFLKLGLLRRYPDYAPFSIVLCDLLTRINRESTTMGKGGVVVGSLNSKPNFGNSGSTSFTSSDNSKCSTVYPHRSFLCCLARSEKRGYTSNNVSVSE